MKHTKISLAIASAALLAVGTQFAGAVPTMRITSGATVITVADGSGLDTGIGLGIPGIVSFSGAVASTFYVTVDTGVTKPEQGTASRPYMDLAFQATSRNTTGPGPFTIVIEFSEVGFGPMAVGTNFITGIGGTTTGTTLWETLVDPTNQLFGGTAIASQSFSTSPYLASVGAARSTANPFSITQRITITHSGNSVSSGDAELKVPDGGTTLALLGGSLLGLGAIRRKMIKP